MATGKEMVELKKALKEQQRNAAMGICEDSKIVPVYPQVIWNDSNDPDKAYSVREEATVSVAILDRRGNKNVVTPVPNEMVYVYTKGRELWLKTDVDGKAKFTPDAKGKWYFDVPAILPPALRWLTVV